MAEENISQEFRLKNINETKNYFLKETKQNEWMSKNHKKVFATLNYSEHFLNVVSTVTGCISISAYASLLGITIIIMSSATVLKMRDVCNNCSN